MGDLLCVGKLVIRAAASPSQARQRGRPELLLSSGLPATALAVVHLAAACVLLASAGTGFAVTITAAGGLANGPRGGIRQASHSCSPYCVF
jgi:hypothetical protein